MPAVAARAVERALARPIASEPLAQRVEPSALCHALSLQVWRIEKFEAVELPVEAHGHFSTGDCYLVLFTPSAPPALPVLYIWHGRDASADEVGAAAAQAVELDGEEAGGCATQVGAARRERGGFASRQGQRAGAIRASTLAGSRR